MEKRKWYDKNMETSLLGFGAMRLATINGEIDEEKGFALFDKAYYSGVNYFDTARPYTNGKNEAFVGKALKRYPRESFYLATKCSMFSMQTKEDFLGILDKQLETLQTDYVDCYLLHALNKNIVKKIKEWDVINEVVKWKEEGKLRYLGFSFHDDYETFKEILDMYDWDFCQIQLNYMDQNIQQGIQGYYDLKERNIPVIIMEPLKGGKLSSFNKDVEKIFKENDPEASISSWAMRWLGSLDGIKVILSGMNEMDQLEDNLKTFENFKPMTEEENKLVDDVVEALKSKIKVGCTRCNYCMPCPAGVNIPGCFSTYNNHAMYQNDGEFKWNYDELVKNGKDASVCVECGACVSKCPQGIDIPNVLKEVKSLAETLKK